MLFRSWHRQVFAEKSPFSGHIGAAVVSGLKNDRPLRPDHTEVSDCVWNVIQRCWDRDPFQRMTAADVADLLEAEMHLVLAQTQAQGENTAAMGSTIVSPH